MWCVWTGEPGVPDILPDCVRVPGDHPTDLQPLGMSDGSHRHRLRHSVLPPGCALEEETHWVHDYVVWVYLFLLLTLKMHFFHCSLWLAFSLVCVCGGGVCMCVCFLEQLMNLYCLFLFPAKLTVLSQKLFFAAPEEIKEEWLFFSWTCGQLQRRGIVFSWTCEQQQREALWAFS